MELAVAVNLDLDEPAEETKDLLKRVVEEKKGRGRWAMIDVIVELKDVFWSEVNIPILTRPRLDAFELSPVCIHLPVC